MSITTTEGNKSKQVAPVNLYAFGFSPWKRPLVKRFLQKPIHFVFFGWQVPTDATLLIWGSRPRPKSVSPNVSLIRLEDGFLRSVGLGADLIQPLSWVIDHTGIYYDSTQPSDLENILLTTDFDTPLLTRAQQLRERLVVEGLTKYNVGTTAWQRPSGEQQVILVPGQVESDASIRLGSAQIQTNFALLQAVRQTNPNAYVIYKPHPDVVAGLRTQGALDATNLCDEVVIDVPMHTLLGQVDEVHVMTSLAGFEALIRGNRVSCYGQPFYAGWGLTLDSAPHPRRNRMLTLDELVAGTLLLYPTYVSRLTHQFISPELALDELLKWRQVQTNASPILRRLLRFFLRRQ